VVGLVEHGDLHRGDRVQPLARRAAFVGAEDNPANTFQAGTVGTPTGFTAQPGCTLLVSLVPRVALSWNAVPGATAYRVLRTDGSGGNPVSTTVSGTSHVDLDVTWSRTYRYRVEAVAGSWTGAPSEERTVTTPALLGC